MAFSVCRAGSGALLVYFLDKAHKFTQGDFQGLAKGLENVDGRVLLAFDDSSDISVFEVGSDGERGFGHPSLFPEEVDGLAEGF